MTCWFLVLVCVYPISPTQIYFMHICCTLVCSFKMVNKDTGVEREISVAAYFEERHKYRLKYPHYPVCCGFPLSPCCCCCTVCLNECIRFYCLQCLEVGSSRMKLPIEVSFSKKKLQFNPVKCTASSLGVHYFARSALRSRNECLPTRQND